MWEIIDNNGTVYSGNEEEMSSTFQRIVAGDEDVKWEGDIKLIQIHSIHR